MIRAAVKWAIVVPGYAAGLSIAIVVLVMGYEVFCRYVLGAPTDWALEISTYLLAVGVCLGGAYTLRLQAHVGMELFYANMSKSGRRLVQRISMLCIFCFAAVLLWYGVKEVRTALFFNERSLTPLAMPQAYPLSLMPIGALLLAIQAVEFFVFPPVEPLIDPADPTHDDQAASSL